jgi:arylsulfatase A-like enzyme
MREPTIFWWPGTVEAAVVMELGTTMDILPTFLDLAGVALPGDRIYDGYSLKTVLEGGSTAPRNKVFYYRGTEVFALRKGFFKAHFATKSEYGRDDLAWHDPPLLYHLGHDPSEEHNVAADHPEVVADILNELAKHRETVEPVTDQLAIRLEGQ